jgi:hypothetical protein
MANDRKPGQSCLRWKAQALIDPTCCRLAGRLTPGRQTEPERSHPEPPRDEA